CTPAPISPIWAACSSTLTAYPRRESASAQASPPIPPPAISTGDRPRTSAGPAPVSLLAIPLLLAGVSQSNIPRMPTNIPRCSGPARRLASPPDTETTMNSKEEPAPPIALSGSFAPGEEEGWLDALSRAMPSERIIPARDIAEPERVELAIVASPDPATLAGMTSLRWIQSLWAGVERLVAEPTLAHLPIVRMVDPELARTMAEAVLAWTLYLHRDVPAYLAQQRERRWLQRPYVAPSARRVGILGLVAIGREAARALVGAGFPVSGWSSSAKRIDGVTCLHGQDGLVALACVTDILVCLLPLTPRTRHIVDAELLRLLPPGAALINA